MSDCTLGAAAVNHTYLFGARVTVRDDSNPDLAGPNAGPGLRETGTRSGTEAVTFSAAQRRHPKGGARRRDRRSESPCGCGQGLQQWDVTAQKARCDFTRPLPGQPQPGRLANPPIAGHRTLRPGDRLRDNQTGQRAVRGVRGGSANGANVTDTARLTAGFPAKVYRRSKAGKRYYTYVLRPSRTVSYGKGGTLRGILRNADGQPITGADVRILVRENRTGAQYVDRGGLTTGADGRVSLGIPAGSSRTYQLTYKAYVGDDNLAARSKATLNTRARITARRPVTSGVAARPGSAARSSAALGPGAASRSSCRRSSRAAGGGPSALPGWARAVATASGTSSTARQLPVPHAAAAERRVPVRARNEQAVAGSRRLAACQEPVNFAPVHLQPIYERYAWSVGRLPSRDDSAHSARRGPSRGRRDLFGDRMQDQLAGRGSGAGPDSDDSCRPPSSALFPL